MTSAYVDLTQLRNLTGNDRGFMIEILEMIQTQSPETVEQMSSQYQNGELKELSAAAHKFKSSINVLGNPGLIDLMKNIELTALDVGGDTQLDSLMSEFEQVCDQLLGHIQEEVAQLKATA